MRGGLVDDADQCAKLLGAGGYSRVVQRICHLGFSFGWDFIGETRGSPVLLPTSLSLPAAQPRLRSSSRKARIRACISASVGGYGIKIPIRRIRSPCCARAASGRAAHLFSPIFDLESTRAGADGTQSTRVRNRVKAAVGRIRPDAVINELTSSRKCEYLMLVRSQATNQRPPDRTARTGDQNSHRVSLSGRLRRLASFSIFCPFLSRLRVSIDKPAHRPTPSMSSLLERGGQVFVVGVDDKDREQLCRRGRACIPADAMDGARRLVPTFARAVDPLRFVI